MIERDTLRREIELTLPETSRRSDWDDVARRARRRPSRRGAVIVALAAAMLVLGTSALAETLGSGFSEWLSGEPGAPASSEDRERFAKRNEASAAPLFPETDLRQLIELEHEGRNYRLLGFRTGGAACLRLEGTDIDEGGDVACVSADELERSRSLAVPVKVDFSLHEVRPGDPPSDIATYGLAAAETRRVVLVGDDGSRAATVANGAFLSVSPGPVIEHTTLRGFAIDKDGVRRSIPLAPALTDEHDRFDTGLPLRGPPEVERTVRGGEIDWLERREPRGEPVSDALLEWNRAQWGSEPPPGSFASRVLGARGFARVVRPEPADFVRIVVAVSDDAPGEVCAGELTRGGIGGGCNPLAQLFARHPFAAGWTYAGAGSQFVTVSGIASDDVARLILFLGTGEDRRVALVHNVLFARVSRAAFPARLVAYDASGRVIGIQTVRGF